jgi:cytochrome c-type biogenesis protein
VTIDIGYLGAFLGGLLSLLSPCSAMLLPAFFAYAFADRALLVARTGVFYLGLVTTLLPLGVLAGSAGAWLAAHRSTLMTVAAGLLIMLGVLQIAGVRLPALSRRGGAGATTSAAVYALGAAYGVAGACTGPLLGAVLTLAAAGGSPVYGGTLLAIFAAGMTMPLLLLALVWKRLGAGGRSWLRPRGITIGPWSNSVHAVVSGALSLVLGVVLLVVGDTEALGSLLSIRTQFAVESWVFEVGQRVSNTVVLALVAAVVVAGFGLDALRRRRHAADVVDGSTRPAGRLAKRRDG